MKKAKVLFFLLSLPLLMCAQKAPNFTILDYDGIEHNLYDDYLDKGKVVMLKIMFVACPPCNLSAPGIQDLYEEFGEGMEDVQFFDLSNKSWDDNDAMKGFADKHGLTFPGAGADGGALSAVSPYVSGQFGTFTGTPTFIVIAPDGEVNFKIPMQNLKSAIEDALNPNGGCANAFGGTIASEGTAPKALLKSDIVGAQVFELEVDGQKEFEYACEFTFPPQALDYYLTVEEDGNDLDGVTIKDIVILLRHLLAITPIESTPVKIAADYTANGVLSVRDISEMRKLILGRTSENPYHNAWVYWHETSDFSQDTSGVLIPDLVTRVELMDVVDSVLTGNFMGVKIGDLSGDINPFFKENKTRTTSTITLTYKDQWVNAGDEVWLEIQADQAAAIMGYQAEFSTDLEIFDVKHDLGWELSTHQTDGDIRLVSYGSTSALNTDASFLSIKLKASIAGMLSDFIGQSTSFESYATDGENDYHFELKSRSEDAEVSITPNPSNGTVWVTSTHPIDFVEVYSTNGQLQMLEMVKGHEANMILPQSSGVFVIRVVDIKGKETIKKIQRL